MWLYQSYGEWEREGGRKRGRDGRDIFAIDCLNRERAEWDCFVLLAIWQLALLQRVLTGALTFENIFPIFVFISAIIAHDFHNSWDFKFSPTKDEFLHTRLSLEPDLSLVEQDLEFLSDVSRLLLAILATNDIAVS